MNGVGRQQAAISTSRQRGVAIAHADQRTPRDSADTRSLLLARFPVFSELPAEQLDELLGAAPLRRAAAGSVLFESNTPCEGFPLVLEGTVRVARTSPGGREIVLYRVSAGEACILSGGCLLGDTGYTARGMAEDDVTLLRIPPDLFQQLILQHPPFRRFVFNMYGERLAEVMELVDEVAFRKLDARLARLLIQRGPVVKATHQNLADELGSVRVFVSRLLRNFEERGWVRLQRERIDVTDVKSLQEFSRQ